MTKMIILTYSIFVAAGVAPENTLASIRQAIADSRRLDEPETCPCTESLVR